MNLAPPKLNENLKILSNDEKELIQKLLNEGQQHLFANWDKRGTNDQQKHAMIQQLKELDVNCGQGGIVAYLNRAKTLLAASRAGDNPFDGWIPSVPEGVHLQPFTTDYSHYESMGIPHLGKIGFVLVAGGLGERLGYHGIKIELPVETVTNTCYLNYYCAQILAIQSRYANPGMKLPLAIMVSDDTLEKTQQLLDNNNYFGMEKSQITLMKQGKVPALMSNAAQIAVVSTYEVDCKPHGHGDVHTLLHSTNTVQRWKQQLGIEWIVFFQDTNALAFFTLPAMLGVSLSLNLDVNSLAIPRYAKQSIGAITKLKRQSDGKEMTINVEYNQLDPLLRSTIAPEGDVNDSKTGYSPYPGNINQLLFRLNPYLEILEQTNGLMPEFVNPKYKDNTKTVFKKPTRLECMMQDYPRLLMSDSSSSSSSSSGTSSSKVGFTMAPSWICYSPVKNNAADAAASIASGVPSASAFTAECDQYFIFAEMLRKLGCTIEKSTTNLTIQGITGILSPKIILHPTFALFPHELAEKLPSPQQAKNINISSKSTLIIQGNVKSIQSLYLDGSLLIDANYAPEHTSLIVNIPREKMIHNNGHDIDLFNEQQLTDESIPEKYRIRGYKMQNKEMKSISTENHTASTCYVFDGTNMIEASALDEDNKRVGGSGNGETCCFFFSC